MSRPPNPRLQRTRVRPSGGRSPLSRQPLGRRWSSVAAAAVALVSLMTGCASTAPSADRRGSAQPYVKPVDVECSSIEAPRLQHRVEPRYPEDVRRQGLEGAVIVHGIIGTDGIVSDITVLQSPSEVLGDLVVEAVRRWRYTPAYCNDLAKPIRVHLTVTSAFRVNQI